MISFHIVISMVHNTILALENSSTTSNMFQISQNLMSDTLDSCTVGSIKLVGNGVVLTQLCRPVEQTHTNSYRTY